MKQVSGIAFFSDPVGYSLVVALLVMTGLGYVYLANLGQLLTSLLHNRVSFNDAQHIRNFHVALFSSVNCGSRILFGALSDIFHRKAGIHRLWFLWAGSIGLVITMVYLVTSVSTADMLIPCTAVVAGIYGMVFGLSPTIVTEFGDKVRIKIVLVL
jgi:MFS family permease